MPQPDRLLTTLRQAVLAFRSTPGRRGRLVDLPAHAEVMVVGDLHGNVDNLRRVLQIADLAKQPQRHLVLQEIVHGPFRYPLGGDRSHQMVDLIAALKSQYSARVHYLIGNHELALWRKQWIAKGEVDQNMLFRAGLEEAYGEFADAVEAGYDQLFEAANFAVRTANRVFISHSLPNAKHQPAFDFAKVQRDEFEPQDLLVGGTLHSLVWGRDTRAETVEAFLRTVDADLLLSGHIPCEQGCLVPNDQQIILDALGTPACYCLFPTDRPLTHADLLGCVGTL
jgi:hypothetical protein